MDEGHVLRLLTDVIPGEHLCCLYETAEEHRTLTADFLRHGLERGEKAVCLGDARAVEAVLGHMRQIGVDVDRCCKRGQLETVVREDGEAQAAKFEPREAIASLGSQTDRAVAQGYPALRVASDMTWACQKPPSLEKVIEYESRLNDFFTGSRCLAICQYDLGRAVPEVLLKIIYAHPIISIGDKVYDNFYYMPPGELLGGKPSAFTLRKVIENLVRRNEAERAILDRHERLEALVAERAAELVQTNAQLRREIEDRQRALLALNGERDFTAAILNTAGALVVVMDRDGRVVRFNRMCEQVTGYSFQEVKDRTFWDLFLTPEEKEPVRALFHQMQAGNFPNHYENYWVGKTGERRLIAWSNTCIVDGSGQVQYIIGTGIDITEQRRAEEALRHSEERLRQAQKMEAIGRLAGGLAHDFNNQLTVATGYCELLLREMRPDNPLRPAVEEILRAARRSETLTSRLLTFSRKQIMHPQVINLADVVADLREMLARMIGEDIRLRVISRKNLGNVQADRGLLEQALMNLVVNARDAMPRGGVLSILMANKTFDEAYAATHPELPAGRYVLLVVRDTGIGMDAETLQQIFDPFFTTKPVGQGTGLGLPMVYGFVKQSGGHITVESRPGKGTTVRIFLPVTEAEVPRPKAAARPAPGKLGTETILLVEDDDAVRTLVTRVLGKGGYKVLPAASPREAIATSEEHPGTFDLLITDLVMPEMDGSELARQLRGRRPDMKVLFISGYTKDAVVQRGVLDSGVSLLTKPFGLDALTETVRSILDAPEPAS
ncbi:MAG: MEDS domain-containing protein [Planctomycetota bacterium]|nr:MEDS domain-containing protein [Planctomycetota bacterium]